MFNPKQEKQLGDFKIWPGCFSAISNYDKGIFLQFDSTNKVIREDTLLMEI